MHSSLSLSNVGGLWYVERAISGLITTLRSYCDSIRSCDISVEGPSGEGKARCWRVELKLRIFDETVSAMMRAPEGSDPQTALSRILADIFARTRAQLEHIAEQHHSCCARGGQGTAGSFEACA